MNTRWLDDCLTYDGSQLRAHWILAYAGLAGDAAVAFRGPCSVSLAEMADLEDVDGPGIAADDMVHVIWECFSFPDLLLAVHRQRLLSAQAADVLRELQPELRIDRDGDDLFVGAGKLSVSIATRSPLSALLHLGVNASAGGAPVPTATLAEMGVDPREFGVLLLRRIADEQESMATARAKVRAKGEWNA